MPPVLPFVLAGAQMGLGAIQRSSARNRREKALSELDYDIPSGTTEQVQLARERASRTGLPGEDITRARIDSDTAEALTKAESVARTPEHMLSLYEDLYGRKMDVSREILEQGARYKSENELQLAKSLGMLAEAENQQFYYNRMVPFLSEMGYAGEQAAGGSANIASGLNTAFSTWMNDWSMDQYKDMYSSVYGNGTVAPPAAAPSASPMMAPEGDPSLGVEPWMTDQGSWAVSPYDEYNIGHPNRHQMNRPGPNYGSNYPAY